LKITAIVCAHNEEKYLLHCLLSLAEQTLPVRVVVVDDRSTDHTYQIAKAFEKTGITVIKKYRTTYPEHWIFRGEHIAEVFNLGLDSSKKLPFISKIDADMKLDPLFFQNIIQIMENDDKLGICSGVLINEKKKAVIGGCRVYRKECWNQITKEFNFKAPELNAWDSFLEFKALSLGWRCSQCKDALAQTMRPTGNGSFVGQLQSAIRAGDASRRLGYLWWFFLVRVIRNLKAKPYILKGLAMLYGWIWSWCRRHKVYDENVASWVRNYQKNRILQVLKLRKQ